MSVTGVCVRKENVVEGTGVEGKGWTGVEVDGEEGLRRW